MNAPDILEAAGTLLLIPGVWTQGAFARNASGHLRSSQDSDAVKFCALSAMHHMKGTDRVYEKAYTHLQKKVNGTIMNWNDTKGQTAENVAKTMFKVAAELRAKQ